MYRVFLWTILNEASFYLFFRPSSDFSERIVVDLVIVRKKSRKSFTNFRIGLPAESGIKKNVRKFTATL